MKTSRYWDTLLEEEVNVFSHKKIYSLQDWAHGKQGSLGPSFSVLLSLKSIRTYIIFSTGIYGIM